MSQVLTITLTESTNISYISDRVACTVKLNMKETFLREQWFSCKYLYSEWTAVRE